MTTPAHGRSARAARATQAAPAASAGSAAFARLAGLSAILAGVSGFLYAIAFLVLRSAGLSALFLLFGGLFASVALVATYSRLRLVDPSFALWALVMSLTGALGSLVHGGYDLANAINPPASVPDLPNQIDPRGLLTFGLMGLGLLAIAWLMAHSRAFPRGLAYLGYLLAILLLVLYTGRLTILDATSPAIAIPAVLTGLVVNPVWYIWLGRALWRRRAAG